MPVSGLALAASTGLRVASLNLCTDEILLLLAKPHEIVSVSYLSRLPEESLLWRAARRYPANPGTLESVVARRPDLVLTMGGGGRSTAVIARRLGIRVVDLPYPSSLLDLDRQAAVVAHALGDVRRAAPLRAHLEELRRSAPRPPKLAAYVGGGGLSMAPDSLGAQWMALAGYRQEKLPGARLDLERLATRPPARLIISNYRAGQASGNSAWLRHPLVRRLSARTVITDGRPWTCAGWPMLAEIRRLRSVAR
jgi:iron complex transport system substrate-binding protein